MYVFCKGTGYLYYSIFQELLYIYTPHGNYAISEKRFQVMKNKINRTVFV